MTPFVTAIDYAVQLEHVSAAQQPIKIRPKAIIGLGYTYVKGNPSPYESACSREDLLVKHMTGPSLLLYVTPRIPFQLKSS